MATRCAATGSPAAERRVRRPHGGRAVHTAARSGAAAPAPVVAGRAAASPARRAAASVREAARTALTGGPDDADLRLGRR
ncbi:hypothetical protein ACPESV_44710 [Streptomyces umbrinus]|uniref:hypothetical protein n=1 Tax=Streptomyces umbrinus TaxID=67370 RepID=UPI003C2C0FFF